MDEEWHREQRSKRDQQIENLSMRFSSELLSDSKEFKSRKQKKIGVSLCLYMRSTMIRFI